MKKIFSLILIICSFYSAHASEIGLEALENEEYDYSYAEISNKCRIYDPYEKTNRFIFGFNRALDKALIAPIARVYGRVTNDYTKQRVGSVLSNLREPLSTINYAAQGKSEKTLKTVWRFILNSTIGIGGLFDVASKFGLKSEPQKFSNTLAHYGVGTGPYIVLPIIGGFGARDIGDALAFDFVFNPITYLTSERYIYIDSSTRLVHYRESALPFTDHIERSSVDPYIATRDAVINASEANKEYPANYVCPNYVVSK